MHPRYWFFLLIILVLCAQWAGTISCTCATIFPLNSGQKEPMVDSIELAREPYFLKLSFKEALRHAPPGGVKKGFSDRATMGPPNSIKISELGV